MLQYIPLVLDAYEKEVNREHPEPDRPGGSFRQIYPPV
jgi:hypothetical protein